MAEIIWDKEAEQALAKAPIFVRGLIRRKVSERVEKKGGSKVTIEDFREAEERFRAMTKGKSDKDLKSMMPAANEPGVEMVISEVCHNELSGCKNVLIRTSDWKNAIEEWIAESGVSEKLRKKVSGDRILYHNKLKISMSGCPNGCSRPQIADIGIVGTVQPYVDPENCTSCGGCEDACPDAAITVNDAPPEFDRLACQGCVSCRNICPGGCISLSEPRAVYMLGGKLGRHPHLAEKAGVASTPEELVRIIDEIVNDYIENGKDGERFAEYWIRTRGKVTA